MSFRIKKDDQVQVITGKWKGAKGKVLQVLADKGKIIVEGVNLKKHHKRMRQGARGAQEGGIVESEAALPISNVMILDPKDNKPTRIGVRITPEGVKQRIAKRSGTVLG